MSKEMQKFKDHFILFVEAGFIAVNQTDEDSAKKLFRASEILDPQNPLPKVGMGYLHLCKLELKQAIKLFNEVLEKDPNNEMAKTFLGLSMSLNPTETAKGEAILEDSAQKAKDPLIKNLAITALDFVEKFVKKSPAPPHIHPSESPKTKHKRK